LGYDIARRLTAAKGVKKGAEVFALQGDLGAGKTTFVQGFLKGLGSKKRATSPTFILMRRHHLHGRKIKNVFHIDAYRLKKPEHLAPLELDVILDDPHNVILIEWPEQAKRFLPKDTVRLRFKYGAKENERVITVTHPGRKKIT
jgi:tRNA threonylcarbamoyladenosine biosynthesis protein TsaE